MSRQRELKQIVQSIGAVRPTSRRSAWRRNARTQACQRPKPPQIELKQIVHSIGAVQPTSRRFGWQWRDRKKAAAPLRHRRLHVARTGCCLLLLRRLSRSQSLSSHCGSAQLVHQNLPAKRFAAAGTPSALVLRWLRPEWPVARIGVGAQHSGQHLSLEQQLLRCVAQNPPRDPLCNRSKAQQETQLLQVA